MNLLNGHPDFGDFFVWFWGTFHRNMENASTGGAMEKPNEIKYFQQHHIYIYISLTLAVSNQHKVFVHITKYLLKVKVRMVKFLTKLTK